jgi:hypothetical protein
MPTADHVTVESSPPSVAAEAGKADIQEEVTGASNWFPDLSYKS